MSEKITANPWSLLSVVRKALETRDDIREISVIDMKPLRHSDPAEFFITVLTTDNEKLELSLKKIS